MNENTLNDTTSPMEAAKGVAKLSGFMWNRWVSNITATKTKSVRRTKKEIMNAKKKNAFKINKCCFNLRRNVTKATYPSGMTT